jgi:hypothetical protein
VHGEVLACGYGAQVVGIVALYAVDEGNSQSGGQERVFAVGFLAAAPAGIAKDVDVGRPEGESIEDSVVALALRLVVLGAASVEMTLPMAWTMEGSHVAAMPMAWGKTVA